MRSFAIVPVNTRLFNIDATGSALLICDHINRHSESLGHAVCKRFSIALLLSSLLVSLSFLRENTYSSAIFTSVKCISSSTS